MRSPDMDERAGLDESHLEGERAGLAERAGLDERAGLQSTYTCERTRQPHRIARHASFVRSGRQTVAPASCSIRRPVLSDAARTTVIEELTSNCCLAP